MNICKRCGKSFIPRKCGKPQLFCAASCGIKFRNDIHNPKQPRKTTRRLGTKARATEFTESQKEIINGTLLGDSCLINCRGHYRLSLTHSVIQREYLQWKRDMLAFVFHKEVPYECVNKKNNSHFVSISSVWHPLFDEIAKELYPPTGKRIPPSFIDNLTPFALAIWYMDDGSYNPNPKAKQGTICTDSFPIEDVEYAATKLRSWGVNCSVYTRQTKGSYGSGKYTRIVLLRSTINHFFDIVRPYIHPSMLYKVR